MEIAFHIGANCTDEDRLLKSLLKNAGAFADQGIKIPGPGKYRRLVRETIENLDGAPPAPNTRGILLDAIVEGESPKRLVMSNSNFICVPNRVFDKGAFYEKTESKIRALIQLFPNDELDLFIGLRNPATFLPAVYEASKATTLDAYLKGFHPTHIRWSDIIKRILHVAPNAQLTAWCNEDTPLIWAELVRDIAGVSSETRITGGYDLLASIMSADGMNRFLNYMQQHPPQTEDQKRKIIAAFLDKYAIEDEIEEEVDVPGITPDLIEDLSDIYEADVDTIIQMEAVHFISP
jgi:hypothetical protein